MSRATGACVPGSSNRSKLMVSARSAQDARAAIEAGVDLLDVKEPRNGPLGMAPASTLGEIAALVGDAVPLGASLGEWLDWSGGGEASEIARVPENVRYLKVGLAGMRHAEAAWRDAYRSWRSRVVEQLEATRPPCWVAVLYADWKRCGAPSPEDILELARDGFEALLVDTFSKTRGAPATGEEDLGGLFDHLTESEIRSIVRDARTRGLELVLSGSLTLAGARRAAELGADVVGLRTSVCRDGRRDGELDPLAIERALASVRGAVNRP